MIHEPQLYFWQDPDGDTLWTFQIWMKQKLLRLAVLCNSSGSIFGTS